MRQDRADDPAQAADLVGLVGGDRRQDDMVHSCPQQRFRASLATLVGSAMVSASADDLLPVPSAAIQVGDQGGGGCTSAARRNS